MPAIRITKRIIDPITFTERVGLEFIPRLEDSVLDDQLAGSMCYAAPRSLPIPPPPPGSPPPPLSDPEYRHPTPPKSRDKADNPNNPRSGLETLLSPKRISLMSPRKALPSPKVTSKNAMSLGSILEDSTHCAGGEESMSDLSYLQVSVVSSMKKTLEKKGVRFADEVELNEISRFNNSMLDDMFYGSVELANFRYEAFMEEAGLNIEDFD